MVVREPSERVRAAFQLDHFGEEEKIFVYESDTETWDKREGGGVQMTGISKYLSQLADEYNTDRKSFLFVVRHLLLPEDQLNDDQHSLIDSQGRGEEYGDRDQNVFPRLEEFLLESVGKRYESDKKSLVRVAIRKNNGKSLDELFCSELIAETYKVITPPIYIVYILLLIFYYLYL